MKEEIKKKIIQLADPKYKEFQSKLCPNINNIVGVRIPILRKYAKELVKENQVEKILKEIDNQYYEEIMLQGIIIGLNKQKYQIVQNQIENFIPKIDNWAICDTFCAGLKITIDHKQEMWELIQKYLVSEKQFEVRFAIVMILDYYIEEEYIEQILKIFDSIQNTEYYVKMAIAWAISVCLINFCDKTVEYLKVCKLDNFTYNKSLQKAIESYRVTDRQKDIFRKMKK